MAKNFTKHKRQFLLGSIPRKMHSGWESVQIGKDSFLSYCPSLPVHAVKDQDSSEWYLIGIAIQTDKDRADPLIEIGNSSTNDIKEIYKSWSGRWVLIGNDQVHIDCGGLLGCFYNSGQEQNWVSSSLAILEEIGAFQHRPEVLKHQAGIEWYPLPTSGLEGVSKLLPSQVLNLQTLSPEVRELPKPVLGLTYEEITAKIAERLRCTLVNASRTGKDIEIALTSGYDSRLVLAAAAFAGIKIKSFTRANKRTAQSDIVFPPKLAKAVGYTHTYIKDSGYSREREDLITEHIGGNVHHPITKTFANGQYNDFKSNTLILSGGVFEVARCYYWKNMEPELSASTVLKARQLQSDPDSYNFKALSEWKSWVEQTPTDGLDWRDRFYLEQRVAGWLSSLQQAQDITDTESLHIMNSHDLMSLFLSIPINKRKTSEHHIDLIRIMYPGLLQYPFNAPDQIFTQIQKLIEKVSKKIKRRLLNSKAA